MPSYHVKEVIKSTVRRVAVASVPTAFTPGFDTVMVGGFWTYMINEIADDHNVTFGDDTAKFIGVIASGVGAYWVGTNIINKVLSGVIAVLTLNPFAFGISAALLNVILNGYFTWSVGKKADRIFGSIDNSEAGTEIAAQIVRAVCHIPSPSEFHDFFSESGLTIRDFKDMLD